MVDNGMDTSADGYTVVRFPKDILSSVEDRKLLGEYSLNQSYTEDMEETGTSSWRRRYVVWFN